MADMKQSPPERNGDSVHSSTSQSGAPMAMPLDDMHTGNIAGHSPVDGMHGSEWDDSLKDVGEVGIGMGVVTTLGAWPIQGYGNNPRQRSV